jgi:hypothetical protein
MKHIKFCCLLVLLILLFSCNQREKQNLMLIKFENYSFILRNNESSSFSDIPLFKMNFTIKNQSNNINFFCSKGYFLDKRTHSKTYLLDTIKNQIISVYSNSRNVIEENKEYDVFATINLKENKDYFSLSNDFFDKNDYSKDTEKLNDLFLEMINNSIIIYNQDERDLKGFLLNDTSPEKLEQNVIIKIEKPGNVTEQYFGIKKKKIKIIKVK